MNRIGEGDVDRTIIQGEFLLVQEPVSRKALIVPLRKVHWWGNNGWEKEEFRGDVPLLGQDFVAHRDVASQSTDG